MNGNWKDKVKDKSFTPRADAAEIKAQQYCGTQASGGLQLTNSTQLRPQQSGTSQAFSKFQPNKGAQLRTQQHGGSQAPVKVQSNDGGPLMGKSYANIVAPMNGAQRALHAKDLSKRGPPPNSMYRYSQSRGAVRTNTYAPTRGSSLNPALGGRPRRQTNAFIPNGKPQRQIMQKSMYKLGVVVRAPHHEEDRDGGSGGSFRGPYAAEQMARTLTKTVTGDWLFTKHRKFIVVALHKNNYHALPLYTHNGNGLTSNYLDPDEWVSVQDHRAAPIEALSRHSAVRTETLEEHVQLFHPKSAANLAYGVPRPYNLPVVYEGKLSDDSRDYLLSLYQDRTNRGSSL